MTTEEIKDLQERFDQRYKLKTECDMDMDTVTNRLSIGDTQFAVLNTKMNALLWLFGVVGTAVIGFLIKYVFGG